MQTVGNTKFVFRQCESDFKGTKVSLLDMIHIPKMTEKEFNLGKFTEGYAPFCKIVVLENVFNFSCPIVEVTNENEHLLRTSYQARNDKELSVLTRYFPVGDVNRQRQKADKVNVILYSKEQMEKENDSSGSDWDIVSINAESSDLAPMTPNTMIRNHLGVKFGGSGKEIDLEEYKRSVEFWTKHAIVG